MIFSLSLQALATFLVGSLSWAAPSWSDKIECGAQVYRVNGHLELLPVTVKHVRQDWRISKGESSAEFPNSREAFYDEMVNSGRVYEVVVRAELQTKSSEWSIDGDRLKINAQLRLKTETGFQVVAVGEGSSDKASTARYLSGAKDQKLLGVVVKMEVPAVVDALEHSNGKTVSDLIQDGTLMRWDAQETSVVCELKP